MKCMQFYILVAYNATLCENLDALFKNFKHNIEVLLFWDFNLNWLDKHCKKKFKISSKNDFSQMIEAPTRITRNTQTLIDLILYQDNL